MRLALGAVLLLSAVAAIWAGVDEKPDAPVRAPRTRTQTQPASRDPAAQPLRELDLEKLSHKSASAEDIRDAFESRSWLPPPPQPSKVKEQPRPPALPFIYVGRIVEEGSTVVFLARQDRSYIVRAGDTLDGAYKVEEIGPDNMMFTYLPLNAPQILAIGSAQ